MERLDYDPEKLGHGNEKRESVTPETKVLTSQEFIDRIYKGESLPQDDRFLPTEEGGSFRYLFLDDVLHYRRRNKAFYPVVELGDTIVAISELEIDPRNEKNFWIKFISVDPNYQNQGYASQLIEKIFEYAKEQGYSLQTSRYSDEGIKKLREKIHELAKEMSVTLIDEYAEQKPVKQEVATSTETTTPTKEQMVLWAEELDRLQKEALRRLKQENETIEYVHWIVEDLRDGNLEKAKANYRNQSDKYDQWREIKEFLLKIGVAEKFDPSKYFTVDED